MKHRPKPSSYSVLFLLVGKHQEAQRSGEGKKHRTKLPATSDGRYDYPGNKGLHYLQL